MIFIDESFKNIFVMAAVVGPRAEVEETIRIARTYIKKHNKSNRHRRITLPEIKDSEIHRKFPNIKQMVLENLVKIKSRRGKPRESIEIYSVYLPKEQAAGLKETEVYKILAIELLKRILINKNEEVEILFDVYFDQYGEKVFKEKLYQEIIETFPDKKISLTHVSSQQDKAIQTADVVTGTIRRYLLKEDINSIEIFRPHIRVIESIEIK